MVGATFYAEDVKQFGDTSAGVGHGFPHDARRFSINDVLVL